MSAVVTDADRNAATAAGLCTTCGKKPSVGAGWRCAECQNKNRLLQVEWRREGGVLGRCTRCVGRVVNGHSVCRKHLKVQQERNKLRRSSA